MNDSEFDTNFIELGHKCVKNALKSHKNYDFFIQIRSNFLFIRNAFQTISFNIFMYINNNINRNSSNKTKRKHTKQVCVLLL